MSNHLQDVRPTLPQRDHDEVYPAAARRLFHKNRLSKLIRGYLDAAGVKKRGSCHMDRHTTATLMMEGGADLRSIQSLLGHANLNTTQIYTHATILRLREVHDKTHPAKPNEKKEKPEEKS